MTKNTLHLLPVCLLLIALAATGCNVSLTTTVRDSNTFATADDRLDSMVVIVGLPERMRIEGEAMAEQLSISAGEVAIAAESRFVAVDSIGAPVPEEAYRGEGWTGPALLVATSSAQEVYLPSNPNSSAVSVDDWSEQVELAVRLEDADGAALWTATARTRDLSTNNAITLDSSRRGKGRGVGKVIFRGLLDGWAERRNAPEQGRP
ncbi:MAG: hypothetical protein AAGG50_10045 [Bacteroidota bacterium]